MESADAARARAAADLLERHGGLFRGVARRVSLCPADADDALQRAALILLTKAPAIEGARLTAWMHVVTRREALAVRRSRERMLGSALGEGRSGPEPVSDRGDPVDAFERRERVAEARRALSELRPNERLALLLQAQGYSYAEICRSLDWTYTKVNRSLAEGRCRLRSLL